MPVSTHTQISPILDQVLQEAPKTVLDVGCGLGVYGGLCRIYLEGDNLYDKKNRTWNRKENWATKIDCIEGFEKYITDFHRVVYNNIFIGNASAVLTNLPDKGYDLVLALDIVEHLEKLEGVQFIKELQRVGKTVILATPSQFVEQTVPENPFENHRSVWDKDELVSLGFIIFHESQSLIGIWRSRDREKMNDSGYSDIVVRLYQDGDEYLIAKLFREVFGREMSLDEWDWKYKSAGDQKIYSSVAVSKTHGIVAHYGCMARRMTYQGKEVYGLAIGDVMVHPKFRGTKLFKKVTMLSPEESGKEGISIGYGFPNERAMRLPEKLGLYEKVEDVFESTKDVGIVTNWARFFYKLFPLRYDDKRINYLWQTVKPELQLALVRDADYLTWRYKNHPFFVYELWGLKKRWGSELLGLAVLRREDTKMFIIDFLCTMDMLDVLFLKVENYAHAVGSKTIVLWHPEYLKNRLEGLGYVAAPSITCIPRSTHKAFLPKDKLKGIFFYTMGDTDFL